MLKSIGVLVVLAVGAAGWWLFRSADAEKKRSRAELGELKSSLEQMRESDARTRRELQALQREPNDPKPQLSGLAQSLRDSSSTDTDGATGIADRDAATEPAQAPPAPPVEMAVALQEAFDESPPGSVWTRSALDDVMAAVTPTLPRDSTVYSKECRGELCRVEVAHATEGGHRAFVETLVHSPTSWRGPGSVRLVQTADGHAATLAFFGKPGSDAAEDSVWRGGVAQR